jgi:hypothetical protein
MKISSALTASELGAAKVFQSYDTIHRRNIGPAPDSRSFSKNTKPVDSLTEARKPETAKTDAVRNKDHSQDTRRSKSDSIDKAIPQNPETFIVKQSPPKSPPKAIRKVDDYVA